jgi:hypothetical protein
MDDPRTCGQGLAAQSVLPSKLGELIASLAENLEIHMKALDTSDPAARMELEAYTLLARDHREIATRLHAVGDRMAGYRELPMGRHDMKAMTGPRVLDAFARFVRIKHELQELLRIAAKGDQEMLDEMRAPGGGQHRT